MIIIGIILAVVGAALLYFFPERLARFGGAVFLILGIVLVLLGVLDTADVNLDAD